MTQTKLAVRTLPVLLAGLFSGTAMAAGFQLQNQNGAGTSSAYAGAAAMADDASTIFFNPAGMTFLPEGHTVSVGGTILQRSLRYDDRGTTTITGTALQPGSDGGQAGGVSLIPVAFYTMSLTPDLRFGFGITAPFGNKTEYDKDFKGSYQGYYSHIKTLNLNPSIAYRVTPTLSVGAGINYQKIDADLRSFTPIPQVGGVFNTKLEGDDTAWGWNVGAIWQVSPSTRIGVTYRSSVDYDVEGTLKLALPAAVPAPLGALRSRNVKVGVELPETASIAVFQKLSDKWDMMGDFTWTGWSSLPELKAVSKASGAAISSERLGFDDSWRVGFGGQFHQSDSLKLRAGIAYDRTPVPNKVDRTVRLPDTDRYWVAFGARYFFSPNSSIDVGYAHIFFEKGKIDRRTLLSGTPTGQFVRGEFETSANLLSAQFNHTF